MKETLPDKTIIHVDMDAFYASVECRDNPVLADKPVVVGGLPGEPRSVVATCNYEARKYGIHSAMSISEAVKRCPHAVFMHGNMHKYSAVSDELHKIWCDFTDAVEFVSLDEGYLDVTGSLRIFGSAREIAHRIKARTKAETGLTCSVGVGYSMSSAKLASEEKKPDGYFEIPDAAFFRNLIIDRDVRVLFGVGAQSAEKLKTMGILTVRDMLGNEKQICAMFGKHGKQMVELARGIDPREVEPYYAAAAKSVGREQTFRKDTDDYEYIKSFLLIFAKELSMKMRTSGLYAQTVTLKLTFGNMQSVTRSKSGVPICETADIYREAAALLDAVERRPVRLAGISVSGFTKEGRRQLTLEDMQSLGAIEKKEKLNEKLFGLQQKYGSKIIKTGAELKAENRIISSENDVYSHERHEISKPENDKK